MGIGSQTTNVVTDTIEKDDHIGWIESQVCNERENMRSNVNATVLVNGQANIGQADLFQYYFLQHIIGTFPHMK